MTQDLAEAQPGGQMGLRDQHVLGTGHPGRPGGQSRGVATLDLKTWKSQVLAPFRGDDVMSQTSVEGQRAIWHFPVSAVTL